MENNNTYLGELCKLQHNYEDSNNTLRYKSDRSCIECKKIQVIERAKKRKIDNIDNNSKHYFGALCNNNHIANQNNESLRYISNNYCVQCVAISDKISSRKRISKISDTKKKYYINNKDKITLKNRKYYEANRIEVIKTSKEYYENNKTHLNQLNHERRKEKLLTDPIFKLNARMSGAISKALKKKNIFKNKVPYLELVDFTIIELKEHLESLFTDGMSWDNYGEWHIDHINPKSKFDYKSPFDESFKECWSIKNFQPLWAKDNLSKNNKTMEEYLLINKLKSNDQN